MAGADAIEWFMANMEGVTTVEKAQVSRLIVININIDVLNIIFAILSDSTTVSKTEVENLVSGCFV